MFLPRNIQQAVQKKSPVGMSALQQANAISTREQQRLNVLRENTIAQTAYTPKAEAAMRGLPMRMYLKNVSPLDEPKGAAALYNPNINTMIFNPNIFDKWPEAPVAALRHEFIHSQDANATRQDPMSYIKGPGTYLDSNSFYDHLMGEAKQYVRSKIGSSLYGAGIDPHVRNTEGMAYLGQDPQVLLEQFGNKYSDIYQPISKMPPSYSPIFPSPEYIDSMLQTQAANRPKQQAPLPRAMPSKAIKQTIRKK